MAGSLEERVESLTFYGTGDEAYELFDHACRFAFMLDSLSESEKAEIVVGWAEDMADYSSWWADEHDLKDSEKGIWG